MSQCNSSSLNKNAKKILFIGLDGATWEIIDPLIAEGKLPNLERLKKEGVYGPLESTETTISPSVWTSIFTGKTPQHHGIHNFMTMQNQLRARRLWDIWEDYGFSVGVAGFLVTWPPRVKHPDSFMIPDHFAPDTTTIPADVSFLREITNTRQFNDTLTLKKVWNYFFTASRWGVDLRTLLKAGKIFLWRKIAKPRYLDYFYREVTIFLHFMEKVFMHLCVHYRPDFAAVYFPGTDVVAHKYWCYFKPEDFTGISEVEIRKYGSVIIDQYIESDRAIGRILRQFRQLTDNLDVYVVSDHGFQSCKSTKYVPSVKIEFLLQKCDLSTKVNYTRIGHSTFLHPRNLPGQGNREFLLQLKKFIEAIVTVEGNIPIFQAELLEDHLKISAQPLWKGYKFDDSVLLNGEYLQVESLVDKGLLLTGMHEKMGIFIMWGPELRKNHRVKGACVYDITPTILALNGFPVARDMDGRVLTEVADETFWHHHPIRWIDTYGAPDDIGLSNAQLEAVKNNEEELKRKLEGLGYMG